MIENYQVFHGGLMRCCLETLKEEMRVAEAPPKDGDKLSCRYHGGYGMIFSGGAWRWNKPEGDDYTGTGT